MRHLGKRNILGVLVDCIDYEAAVDFVIDAAHQHRPAAVSALAVHGIMTGVSSAEHRFRLNHFDLIVPDGQPVRWALNLLHHAGLSDRVYGPNLMLRICKRAEQEQIPVFFYGSTSDTLSKMRSYLQQCFSKLQIAGMQASKFRCLSASEADLLAQEVRSSGARILFAGLGCPRQEVWAYEFRERFSIPILAVGAAFPFAAGDLKQSPPVLQKMGMEWFFRLCIEPRRLWRRYILLNPAYIGLITLQALGLRQFDSFGQQPQGTVLYG